MRYSGLNFYYKPFKVISSLFILLFVTFLANNLQAASTQTMHPSFPLLDRNGQHVLNTGAPVSTGKTCGGCHDTDYITRHSFHSDAGLTDVKETSNDTGHRDWDLSSEYYGQWDPIGYRTLTLFDDLKTDMTTAEWVKTYGNRHVGGGPAEKSKDGFDLLTLRPDRNNPEASILDSETGEQKPWDWSKSGVVEMNCFLCHIPQPDNDARKNELNNGHFEWANTATLNGSDIVNKKNGTWNWNVLAFDKSQNLKPEFLKIQDPTNDNCGLCHGLVHEARELPLLTTGCLPEYYSTETTGQIISPQKLSESGMNLAGKKDLYRTWDIHSERLVDCVDCHYSINNPIYYRESEKTRPAHLTFDARRMDIDDYLKRPSHNFAKGQSAYSTGYENSMRRCESCHDINVTHDWLPYKQAHMNAVSCESCHIPKLHAPARRVLDWTILDSFGKPRTECRGIKGEKGSINALIEGYEPILLPRREENGKSRLTPFNLITSWYWIDEGKEQPVRLLDLKKAYFQEEAYHPDILAALDENKDGKISSDELLLNTEDKINAVEIRLEKVGIANPRIHADIQPYGIHHNVTHGDWATRNCETCHNNESRITKPIILASSWPQNVTPEFIKNTNVVFNGSIKENKLGELVFKPSTRKAGLFIIGHDKVTFVQWLGALTLLAVLLGISVHGGLRIVLLAKHKTNQTPLKKVYLYTAYERFWHWLQALAIIGLIFTGLIIHAPAVFGFIDFAPAVIIHNVLGFILLFNAFLAAFYHFSSGKIKGYLPEPKGFFNQAIDQGLFYLKGIFKESSHPFEKDVDKKLNPLQKVTYLVILNILLPLQIFTGIVIWGFQQWPDVATKLGGLGFLVPFHSLIAWFFASFLIMHMYLTTTGHTPLSSIKAMIVGWEEVEIHSQKKEID